MQLSHYQVKRMSVISPVQFTPLLSRQAQIHLLDMQSYSITSIARNLNSVIITLTITITIIIIVITI